MSLTVKEKGGDFAQVPAGTHTAINNGVIDLGHQDGPFGIKPQIFLSFELPEETIEIEGEQKPMIIGSFYTASLSEKANLRRDLESWRGKAFTAEELDGFNIKAILGKPCTLSVYHNENGKARIRGISPLMKGAQAGEAENPLVWFDLDHHDEHCQEFSQVPEWLQGIIKQRGNPESENPAPPEAPAGDFDDQIPF